MCFHRRKWPAVQYSKSNDTILDFRKAVEETYLHGAGLIWSKTKPEIGS